MLWGLGVSLCLLLGDGVWRCWCCCCCCWVWWWCRGQYWLALVVIVVIAEVVCSSLEVPCMVIPMPMAVSPLLQMDAFPLPVVVFTKINKQGKDFFQKHYFHNSECGLFYQLPWLFLKEILWKYTYFRKNDQKDKKVLTHLLFGNSLIVGKIMHVKNDVLCYFPQFRPFRKM